MGSQIYYDSPSQATVVTPVTFVNATGTPADPSSVSCVVTDPAGTATTYTYGGSPPNNIVTKTATGVYALTLTGLTVQGLWNFVWVGTGNGVQQVQPGTFRLIPLTDAGTGMSTWYCGMEELKSRLAILPTDQTYRADDYEIQMAIQVVSNWINTYCARHFYKVQETRTFMPVKIDELEIDDLCSDPAVVSGTQVNLDYTGSGVYNVSWQQGVNYVLKYGDPSSADIYNRNSFGVPRPYRQLQILQAAPGGSNAPGGGFLPFIWPFTNQNRVQITGTWGWDVVPPDVTMAALMLATDIFKSKDAPWGVAGVADLGIVKVQSNPWVVELLRPYLNARRKVGVL